MFGLFYLAVMSLSLQFAEAKCGYCYCTYTHWTCSGTCSSFSDCDRSDSVVYYCAGRHANGETYTYECN